MSEIEKFNHIQERFDSFIQSRLMDVKVVTLGKELLQEIRATGRFLSERDEREKFAQMARDVGERLFEKTGEYYPVRLEPPSDIQSIMTKPLERTPEVLGNVPALPSLFVGRQQELHALIDKLHHIIEDDSTPTGNTVIIRGWPGVGKTALVTALAHLSEISDLFPDGVLWTSLGDYSSTFINLINLASWGRHLGLKNIAEAKTLEEISSRLTAVLRDKRMLLIIDDVWETETALPFRVGGRKCATVFTTRFHDVARELAGTPSEIFVLPVLSDEESLTLLQVLAPTVVEQYPGESLALVQNLEGLPLAIQVAGRLLTAEAAMGWGIKELLEEIQEGARLLEATAPADRADLVNQITPTVAALLKKGTDSLDESVREQFAFLGAFAPKPATFDLAAMAAVWAIDDPKASVRELVDRGLLEPVGERFQMHALLVMHARSLLDD